MLGDGLKKTLPKQGRNPRKIRGLLSIFLTPLDGCFRCSTPFLPIGVVTGAVTSFLKDGVLQKMDKSWHLVDVIYY